MADSHRILLSLLLMAIASNARADDAFDRDVKPFLKTYCQRCHHADKQTSGVSVDHLDANMEDRHLKLWDHVRIQIRDGAMPPEDAKQPGAEERKKAVQWIEDAMKTARLRPTPKNGSVRRLTVAQYKNTLRELLLLEDNVAEALPPDAVSRDGFVNNQETLQLSPLLLEAYFDIADTALNRSIVDPKSKPVIQNFRLDFGAGINRSPIKDNLILGADSLLLSKSDFTVEELKANKPFAFEPFHMRTKYRFIEGYQGNDTVRGWREYDSIYHSVFACMRGSHGYPKGRAYSTVSGGLLLRPAIPSSEVFGESSTYGPRANFKIALRELPEFGRFRVTVMAAKYDDGLLLDPGSPSAEGDASIISKDLKTPLKVNEAGIYQVDCGYAKGLKVGEITLSLGERSFTSTPTQNAFLVVRLPAGELPIEFKGPAPERLALTKLAEDHPTAKKFLAFEQRSPHVGVHMGFRRDCGSTLAPVGEPQTVRGTNLKKYVFEGAIQNYPDPNVEKDNVNYLAGVREIGVRSEYTDGRDMPRLLIRSVEFEGPLYEAWPPASHTNLFTSESDAKKTIRDFATRAFRRPITAEEEAAFIAVYDQATKNGSKFHDAVKDAFQVILTSPQFLFLIETSRTPEAEPLESFELASKLSYFLWNGPPDAALLKRAASGELSKSLDAEVERMIADPRFNRFTEEFASQWLALDKFSVLEPDRKRFPKLTRDTRAQLRLEPIRFFEHITRNNLPVRSIIASDFVMANETVASYYGLGGASESGLQFQPVKHIRPDLGGLLTQPAILAGLSDGRESNPVKRGGWLARRIVAEPPDDPPPNVPQLKEETKNLTLRQRLEQHRNQPGCANCHSKIDPWGVPFEEFDAAGLFKSGKIDARSTLPDKTEIANFAALRSYLADDRIDQVAFSMLKHLATYATGRSLTYRELEFLRKDGLRLKANGYRMKDLIRYVVTSPMFLEK